MRILLINDTDGRENIGCRLTSRGLKQNLLDALRTEGVSAHIMSAPWLFRKSLSIKLAACLAATPRGGLRGRFLKELSCYEYGPAALDSLALADCVVFQPEGTVNDKDEVIRILRILSLPLYAAVVRRKPTFMVNGTFPLFDDTRREIVARSISACAGAYMRDSLSAEHYQTGFIPDAACSLLQVEAKPFAERDSILITSGAGFSPEADQRFGARALEHCAAVGLRPVVLTKKWQHFLPLRERIWQLGGELYEFAEVADAVAIIRRCRYHLGGRYHMAILCACLDIPTFLVRTNTHKNLWLARDVRGITIINPDELADDEVASKLVGIRFGDVQNSMNIMRQSHLEGMTRLARDLKSVFQSVGPPDAGHVVGFDRVIDVGNLPFGKIGLAYCCERGRRQLKRLV